MQVKIYYGTLIYCEQRFFCFNFVISEFWTIFPKTQQNYLKVPTRGWGGGVQGPIGSFLNMQKVKSWYNMASKTKMTSNELQYTKKQNRIQKNQLWMGVRVSHKQTKMANVANHNGSRLTFYFDQNEAFILNHQVEPKYVTKIKQIQCEFYLIL